MAFRNKKPKPETIPQKEPLAILDMLGTERVPNLTVTVKPYAAPIQLADKQAWVEERLTSLFENDAIDPGGTHILVKEITGLLELDLADLREQYAFREVAINNLKASHSAMSEEIKGMLTKVKHLYDEACAERERAEEAYREYENKRLTKRGDSAGTTAPQLFRHPQRR
jgi:hypothetical protein